jgi:spermidine synthase
MPRPWKLIERVDTPDGPLELRQRDTRDFMISIAGRVLMSSIIHRSESMIAEVGCERAKSLKTPRVLIGGLGLGITLRSALDVLPAGARVCVAELNPVVVSWGRGPLRELTAAALEDPRVEVVVGDVAAVVRAAAEGLREKFDAIIVDLYLGPAQGADADRDPLYGRSILKATRTALKARGSYTVWGEDPDPSFERRMAEAGFRTETLRNRGGGPRHVIYVGRTGD